MTEPRVATTAWPKPYILQIYKRAIEEGCIRLSPIGGEENYKSLAAAFYRARRKTDSQHDLFIEPSYHLCTITWESERDSALVTYDRLPDGMELPKIESVDDSTLLEGSTAQRQTQQLLAPPVEGEAEQPDFNSADFVQNLVAKVGEEIERSGHHDSEQGDEVT